MDIDLMRVWNTCKKLPKGNLLVSKMICHKIPFFKTIKPLFIDLEPNYCKAQMPKTKFLINHLGSIHAIALCNMAEFTGGSMAEVSVPKHYRWIPKGMTVEYLQKATTDLTAIARPLNNQIPQLGEYDVEIEVFDQKQILVFRAVMNIWISEKSKK